MSIKQIKIKRYIIIILGWLFLILGVVGLVLPVLQGILFIMIGLYLLARESKWASDLLNRLKVKHPQLAQKLDEVKTKVKNFILKEKNKGINSADKSPDKQP